MITRPPKEAFRDLREQLTAAGAFRRHETWSWIRTGILLVVGAGLVTAQVHGPVWLLVALMPITAIVGTALAVIGHEGAHRSFSKSRVRNELLFHLTFPLFGGLGALYWKSKHNVKHHGHPNVIGADDDLNMWPMASSRLQHEAAGPVRRWVQRHHQWWIFWPLASQLALSMRASTIEYLWKHARTRGIDGAWVLDLVCYLGHYVVWLVLPAVAFGLGPALAFYFLYWTFASLVLVSIFMPAHLGLDLHTDHPGGWALQLEATRNLRVWWSLRFVFSGLDYQVEHHLFPKIPHRRLPKAAPIVRAWATELGLPYKEIGLFRGIADGTRFLARAWRYTPRGSEDSEPAD